MTQPVVDNATGHARSVMQVRSGANWFYWIAGLSVVNSIAFVSGANFMMTLGLASSLMAAAFLRGFGTIGSVLGIVVTAGIAGVFALFGWYARKGQAWAFVVGGVLYLIDGGIFFVFGDFLPAIFHVLGAVGIFTGYRALLRLTSALPPGQPPAMAGVAVGPGPVPSAPPMAVSAPLPEPNRMPGDDGTV